MSDKPVIGVIACPFCGSELEVVGRTVGRSFDTGKAEGFLKVTPESGDHLKACLAAKEEN